jgi:hypothetical protein
MSQFANPIQFLVGAILLLLGPAVFAADCTPDRIELHSQAEVDNFQAEHGPCDSVVADLGVGGDDIVSLEGLSGLRRIGHHLVIHENDQLTELSGLNSITEIGASLAISDNDSLTDLSALSGLTTIPWALSISFNAALPDLEGLNNLTSIAVSTTIRENALLENIDALSNISFVGANISVTRNPLLRDLAGLAGVRGSVGDIRITENDSLIDLEGLDGITTARTLTVQRNNSLKGLVGLSSLSELSGLLKIESNDILEDLRGLETIRSAGSLAIINNDALARLDGLDGLTTLEAGLGLFGNLKLRDVGGLSNLTYVGGGLRIDDNDSLSDLAGFYSLQRVGLRLHIIENGNLASLDGLGALEEVGELRIRINPSLNDCRAIAWLVDPIDHFDPGPGEVEAPDVASEMNLGQNQKGCNSIGEILGSIPLDRINTALTDAWYTPATNGQGFLIVVYPEMEQIFLAWFTYDTERPNDDVTAMVGEPGHRWITAQGAFDGNIASLTIHVASGGIFDSAVPQPQLEADGEIRLEFTTCNEGLLTYDIPSISRQGMVPIERLTLDNVPNCYELAQAVYAQHNTSAGLQ